MACASAPLKSSVTGAGCPFVAPSASASLSAERRPPWASSALTDQLASFQSDWTNPTNLIVSAVSVVLVVLALVVAWRSGREVEVARRQWTRAWWIIASLLAPAVDGYAIPLGAMYVLIRYLRGGHSLVRGRLLTPLAVTQRSALVASEPPVR